MNLSTPHIDPNTAAHFCHCLSNATGRFWFCTLGLRRRSSESSAHSFRLCRETTLLCPGLFFSNTKSPALDMHNSAPMRSRSFPRLPTREADSLRLCSTHPSSRTSHRGCRAFPLRQYENRFSDEAQVHGCNTSTRRRISFFEC